MKVCRTETREMLEYLCCLGHRWQSALNTQIAQRLQRCEYDCRARAEGTTRGSSPEGREALLPPQEALILPHHVKH